MFNILKVILLASATFFNGSVYAREEALWYFPNADESGRQGFIRIANKASQAGTVTISGFTDNGLSGLSDISFTLEANEVKGINSSDLQDGNASKGLIGAFGSGSGDWRLTIESSLDFDVNSYMRTSSGFLTSIHDVVAQKGSSFNIPIFNPASNTNQVSSLRVINLEETESTIEITGVDDSGQTAGPVSATINANYSSLITAQDLELGNQNKGLMTGLGDGQGKWRLTVTSDDAVKLVSLLSDPNGYLTNLSLASPESLDFSVSSSSYKNGAVIPSVHACANKGGSDTSPQLQWINVPSGTDSFAVIMDDEISPCGKGDGACQHWNVVNLPLSKKTLAEGEDLSGSEVLENSSGYAGPCPPNNHSYNITVYALDENMPVLQSSDLGSSGLTRSQFSSQYSQYILEQVTHNGQYQ